MSYVAEILRRLKMTYFAEILRSLSISFSIYHAKPLVATSLLALFCIYTNMPVRITDKGTVKHF